eukprot:11731853-Heterocapsa_arctica.AAC.1
MSVVEPWFDRGVSGGGVAGEPFGFVMVPRLKDGTIPTAITTNGKQGGDDVWGDIEFPHGLGNGVAPIGAGGDA